MTHRRTVLTLALLPAILLGGCRSASIATTVKNDTGAPISEVEIEYPSASFGTDDLPAGGAYSYRIEVIGSGPMKASWIDAARQVHTSPGPSLQEKERGTLTITLNPGGTARWDANLH